MAEDRKDPPAAGTGSTPQQAIPNRDRKREAPIIDARPIEVVEVKPSAEAGRPGQVKAGEAKPAEPPKGDTAAAGAKTETAKPEAAKTEAGKIETAKTDSAKTEPAKTEPAKTEPAKADAARTEPSGARTAGAAAAAARPEETAKPQRGGAGFMSVLLAGVAGAAIALAGGYMLVGRNAPSAQQVEALVASGATKAAADAGAAVAAIEQKFRGELDRQAGVVAGLGKQLAASEAQTKKLEAELAALRELASKAPAAAPAAAVDLGPIETGLGDLEKRIATIEAALSAPKTAARATDPDVKPPVGDSASPAPGGAAVAPPALLADVSDLSRRLKALESRPQTPPVDLAPLQQRLQEIEKRLAPLAEKIGPLEQKIAPLEEKIAPLAAASAQNKDALGSQSKDIAASKARADAAALAVAARSLADAVAAGLPFATLLKSAQALGADGEAVKKLQPVAEKGVPTSAALTAQFEPLAAAIVEAENRPAPNASFTERLAASAGKLVRVKPAEDTQEETTPALAARIGGALRAGRPAEALALYAKLPAGAQEKASAWAGALRARIAADDAARTILNGALARLAQP